MAVKSKNKPKATSAVKEFVKIICEQMKLQGVSCADLADKAGVGKPYLYRVIKGEQVPSFDWAEKVGSVLGVKINFEKVP